jgi:hypothetical protein
MNDLVNQQVSFEEQFAIYFISNLSNFKTNRTVYWYTNTCLVILLYTNYCLMSCDQYYKYIFVTTAG